MTLSVFLASVALGLSGLAFVLFPDFRKKTKIMCGGLLNVFIEDKAKTPEGAKAIFQQAIAQAEDKYNKANNMLRLRSGELETAKSNLILMQNKLKKVESDCETLVQRGKYEEATILSTQRDEFLVEIERQTKMIETLGPVVEECKGIANHNEANLRQLRIKKTQIIADLEMNKQLTAMYDDLDELKKTDMVSKLLGSVEEGHQESKKMAIGAKTVHENRLETKATKAQAEVKNITSNDYIESLKKKYEK